MPVRVDIPVRIRIDRASLEARADELDEALVAAVGRALARSREVVLAPRLGYMDATVEAPTFRWTGGASVAQVPGELRGRVEARLAQTLCALAADLLVRVPDDAPEVLPADPSDRFDDERFDPTTGLYEVPSYGKPKGAKKKVDLKKGKGKPATPKRKVKKRVFAAFKSVDKSFYLALYAAARISSPSALPNDFAVLAALGGKRQLIVFRGPAPTWRLINFVITAAQDPDEKLTANVYAYKSYQLEFESDASAGERASGLVALRQGLADRYLQRGLAKLSGHTIQEAEQAALEAKARAYALRLTKDYEKTVGAYYKLTSDGQLQFRQPVNLACAGDMPRETMPVYSLVEDIEVEIDVDAEGEAQLAADRAADQAALDGLDGIDTGAGEGGISDPQGIPFGRGIARAPGYDPTLGRYSDHLDVKCEPYDREPSIDTLGEAGVTIRRLIARIADRLEIPPCQYAANFLIVAANAIGARAQGVERYAIAHERGTTTTFVSVEHDDKGRFYFAPVRSASIQYLRYLGETIPLLRQLWELVNYHIAQPMADRVYFAWASHFFEKVISGAISSCERIFIYACQVTMLQLLNASLDNIEQRQRNLPQYIKTFKVLIQSLLSDNVELTYLRTAIHDFRARAGDATGGEAYGRVLQSVSLELTWQTGSRGIGAAADPELQRRVRVIAQHTFDPTLMLQLADASNFVQRRAAKDVTGVGVIHQRKDGAWVIRDSKGWDWTEDEVTAALATRQQYAASIDPLINQIAEFASEIRPLADDPTKIDDFVTDLLARMHRKNVEVHGKVTGDYRWAFEHAFIHSSVKAPPTLAHTRFDLQGIHRFANAAIGDAFGGDLFYANAVDGVLASELGWKELVSDLVLVGTIALSIICPPVGAAFGVITGIAMGVMEYRHAAELEDLHGALMNPEQIVSRAEVEIEMFCAQLGLALAVVAALPEVKAAVSAATKATRAIAEEGARAALKRIAVEAIDAELLQLAKIVKDGIIKTVVKEIIVFETLDFVISHVLGAVIDGKIAALEARNRAEGVE